MANFSAEELDPKTWKTRISRQRNLMFYMNVFTKKVVWASEMPDCITKHFDRDGLLKPADIAKPEPHQQAIEAHIREKDLFPEEKINWHAVINDLETLVASDATSIIKRDSLLFLLKKTVKPKSTTVPKISDTKDPRKIFINPNFKKFKYHEEPKVPTETSADEYSDGASYKPILRKSEKRVAPPQPVLKVYQPIGTHSTSPKFDDYIDLDTPPRRSGTPVIAGSSTPISEIHEEKPMTPELNSPIGLPTANYISTSPDYFPTDNMAVMVGSTTPEYNPEPIDDRNSKAIQIDDHVKKHDLRDVIDVFREKKLKRREKRRAKERVEEFKRQDVKAQKRVFGALALDILKSRNELDK